jgi:regulatory protein
VARSSRRSQLLVDPADLPPVGGVIVSVRPLAQRPELVTLKVGRRSTGAMLAVDAARAGLIANAEWTSDSREAAALALTHTRARTYAMNAAARKSMTKRQLEQRLLSRGCPRSLAPGIVQWIESLGVINERAFADAAAASQLARKAVGAKLVSLKLRAKGIDQKTADRAVKDALADRDDSPLESALAFAHKKARSLLKLEDRQAARRRLYSAIARRGFDPDICAEATRQALGRSSSSDDYAE